MSAAPLPPDLGIAEALATRRLVDLLDRVGPAVLVTHSLGGPAGWAAADTRPDLVRAVVAIEPPGPPFLEVPPMGLALRWGLTASPMTFDPPAAAPEDLDRTAPGRLVNLARTPVAVVEAEASTMRAGCGPVVEFLREAGVPAKHLRLAAHDVRGNGHGVMFERNNRDVLDVVLEWLSSVLVPLR